METPAGAAPAPRPKGTLMKHPNSHSDFARMTTCAMTAALVTFFGCGGAMAKQASAPGMASTPGAASATRTSAVGGQPSQLLVHGGQQPIRGALISVAEFLDESSHVTHQMLSEKPQKPLSTAPIDGRGCRWHGISEVGTTTHRE